MRRFIRYLYEYEEEKKVRNVGFVKVEQNIEECVVHIHGKGFRVEENVQGLEVYLFWNTEEGCIGIYQGMTEAPGPALNYQLCYTPENTGEKENYDLVNGIILRNPNGGCYAAVWNDDAVNVCRMTRWEPEESKEQADEEKNEIEKDVEQTRPEESESGDCAEQDKTEENKKISAEIKVRKIQRKDMICLPRCEWKYANNSFLIHGYYNYHHLILTVHEDQLKLGVPGVYHPQEARAAESFGFPEFLPVEELELELSDEEKNAEEKFGYWCRNVRGTAGCVEQKNQTPAD